MTRRSVLGSEPARRGSALKGCLIAAFIILLILIGGTIYIVNNWKSWTGGFMRKAAEQMVQESELPADQKSRILAQVDLITRDWEAERITSEEFVKVFGEVFQGPLITLLAAYAIEKKHLERSGLSADEKADGKLQLQRAARGFSEKKLNQQDIQTILAPLMATDPTGKQTKIKEVVTDSELQKVFAEARQKADAASIPNEPYVVDIAYEIERAVAKSLGRPEPTPAALPGSADAPPTGPPN